MSNLGKTDELFFTRTGLDREKTEKLVANALQGANAVQGYKDMIVDSRADDIVYSSLFSGVLGNYLKGSVANAGFDPDNLPEGDKATMDFEKVQSDAKAWRDIWGAGQGVGSIREVMPARDLVLRMEQEYDEARRRLA